MADVGQRPPTRCRPVYPAFARGTVGNPRSLGRWHPRVGRRNLRDLRRSRSRTQIGGLSARRSAGIHHGGGFRTAPHLARAGKWRLRGPDAPADGVLRSQVFPGLWLDLEAFWANDGTKMLAALNAGLASEDHRKFVERRAAVK